MVHLTEEQRIRICTLLDEAVYTQPELALQYKVSSSTILRLYNKYKKTKSTKDLPKSGCPPILTNREERRAVRYIISGECSTAVQ
ncbi:9249_t:CDS:1, partial [Funneliformis geosporum]